MKSIEEGEPSSPLKSMAEDEALESSMVDPRSLSSSYLLLLLLDIFLPPARLGCVIDLDRVLSESISDPILEASSATPESLAPPDAASE